MRTALAWIISIVSLGYLIPTGVAVGRGKQNALAIGALNLFLGWTLVGWVFALVWSLMTDRTV